MAIVSLLVGCAGATPPSTSAGLPHALEPLAFFVGQWRIEADVTDPSTGKKSHLSALYTIRSDAHDGWLTGSATVGGLVVHEFWGFDPERKDFVRVQINGDGSRGEMHSEGWHGDTIVWTGGALEADGTRSTTRTTQVRHGNDSFHVTWALFDAGQWRPYSDETLTRVR
jgi:hypothetical protein